MNKLMSKIKIVNLKLKLISTSRFGPFDLFQFSRRWADPSA
jgi:hypothetical protein